MIYAKKPKDNLNFSERNLERVFQTLWDKDDLTFTSEYSTTNCAYFTLTFLLVLTNFTLSMSTDSVVRAPVTGMAPPAQRMKALPGPQAHIVERR
jgi:hypothetical protein